MLAPEVPARIRVFTEILGDWPSLTAGGCRFLLQAQDMFLIQVEISSNVKMEWLDGFVLPKVTPDLKLYARFGICSQRLSEATPGVLGLSTL